MNKRGQFYIIIALIISLALFGITYTVNEIKEPVLFSDFNDRLDYFTDYFLEYAKARNPDMELLYIYSDGTDFTVTNLFDEDINVNGDEIPGGEIIQGINLEVGGNDFVHQVPVGSEDFGGDWISSGFSSGPVELGIGGIIHSFRLGENPDFRIIIRVGGVDYYLSEDGALLDVGDDSKDDDKYTESIQQKTNF